MTDPTADTITIVHAPDAHRYEVHDGENVIGFTEYHLSPSGGQVVFVHTIIDEAYGGRGLAGRLAKFALDDVRASGKRIVPQCPYIASYVRKNHEFDDIIDAKERR